jgi:hypothetical protein
MVTIQGNNPVKILKEGKLNKFSGKTTAKDFRSWLEHRIGIYTKTDNEEYRQVFMEILRAYNYFESDHSREVVIELENWKGEGNLDIYKGFTDNFILIEHIKDKESGEVTDMKHEVNHAEVNRLLFWIKSWQLGESHSCYEFAEFLGYKSWKDLWAERKQYFAYYYYPIKVCEAIGIVKYSGRGQITKIR